jgi:hypothetical protein
MLGPTRHEQVWQTLPATELRVLPTIAGHDWCDNRGVGQTALVVDDDPALLSLAEPVPAGMGAEVAATARRLPLADRSDEQAQLE